MNRAGLVERTLDDQALVDARPQIARQLALDGVAPAVDEPGVHVTPVLFEVGVHAGEGAVHRGSSGQV
jgi:hypothetical protein